MKILNLLSFLFLIVLGSAGRVQDTREEVKDKHIAHLERRVKSLEKDSISYAVFKPIHDTITVEKDSIIIQKKTIGIPFTIPLTIAESLEIGRREYDTIQKEKVDSFIEKAKKNKSEMIVLKGKDTIKK